jgi:hypothetical protein
MRKFTAVKPAVQLLQTQEVHPVAHSSACILAVFYPFILYLSLPGLQRPKDRATLLLSARSSPITRVHELCGKRISACYSQALTKRASRKKVRFGSRMHSHDTTPI